jgi:hypothetical protein
VWNASSFASGTYIYRLVATDAAGRTIVEEKRMTLIRWSLLGSWKGAVSGMSEIPPNSLIRGGELGISTAARYEKSRLTFFHHPSTLQRRHREVQKRSVLERSEIESTDVFFCIT